MPAPTPAPIPGAAPVRPRRSVLYMPAANARALEKARTLPADALILDLEDAVAPAAKAEARERAVAAAASGAYAPREVAIRVNALATPWGRADLAAAARSGADAVVLPKVEAAQQLREAAAVLEAAGAPPGMALWAMLETPRGLLRAADIAETALPRHPLACLVMGTSDLAKELRAAHTRDRLPLLTGLGLCLLAARANGLAALDGVHLDIGDLAGFEAACLQGRELGFDGKTLIHPSTLAIANRVFGPTEAELAEAGRIIAAHAEAEAAGKGVVLLDGKLVESLHVEQAHRQLALGAAIAALAVASPPAPG
ncbi:CoA ester lyase [Roseomonas sp. NAR14]|uniref:CoA ester lyase n=1 Tax=Roseomonas acroporae TaxID=2937791 RepID=A0A9X2BXD7_9PROT|nr:CoA ester lyase [Roseomonas acroporae]MCK8784875.1 CoA ester lyase [Roseomonas acroporae]